MINEFDLSFYEFKLLSMVQTRVKIGLTLTFDFKDAPY